jgi:hypothetical protein
MTAKDPVAYDAPEPMVEEIFGASATGEGYPEPAAEPRGDQRLIADLRDVGEALELELRAGEPAEAALERVSVVDQAEADRRINLFLETHRGWRVDRTGDGWVTHPE